MPLNARRRGSKIVTPLTPNREQELISGLKNALDRGETLLKAKQSFINAGYPQAEVEAAARKVPAATPQISKPTTILTPTQPNPTIQKPQPTTTSTASTQPKTISKTFIIILIVSSALILIGAAILGLFWNSWFG